MRLLKSKKGIGESIISDVLSLLAYFLVFIIVIFLITATDTKSKADVKVEEIKVDYNLQLINALRTPVNLTDGRNTTFAEFMADAVDRADCSDKSYPDDITKQEKEDFEAVLKQMEPFFKIVETEKACFAVRYSNMDSACKTAVNRADYFSEGVNEISKKTKECEDKIRTIDTDTDLLSITYPTQKRYIAKASFYNVARQSIFNILVGGGGPFG